MPRSSRQNTLNEPWDRQPDESSKAYEAFAYYRDMGAARSIREVGRRLNKSATLMARWSSRYTWVERALQWDAEQDRLARIEQLAAIKKMKKNHAELAVQMLVKAAQGLKALQVDEMTAANVTMMIDIAAKLESRSRGEPETITEERRRVEDIAANKAIEALASDPGFLAAIQAAYSQAAGSDPAGGAAGSMDSGQDGGRAVG